RLYPLWVLDEAPCSLSGIVCLTGGHGGPVNRLLLQKGDAAGLLSRLLSLFDEVYVEIEKTFAPWEMSVNASLLELASRLGLRAIAGGAITHAARGDFAAQDALVCVETLCTVEEVVGR